MASTTNEKTREPNVVEQKAESGLARPKANSPGIVLASEQGRTVINAEVVAKIAGLAVREVEGVHNLVPYSATQSLSSLAHTVTGRDMRDLGVKVQVGTIEAAVHCRIVCAYGASIPDVSRRIRENVSARVQRATGLRVKQVNIEVVDLYFEQEHVQLEPPVDHGEDELVLQ